MRSFPLLFSILLFSTFFSPAFGQEKKKTRIEVLNANSWEFDTGFADKAERLIGDVRFKHEGAVMRCDSAYLYKEQNSLKAWGNIYINQADTIHIYGDTLFYNGNTRQAELFGNVRLNDPKMQLVTSYLLYDMASSQARYSGGGTLVNHSNNNTLTSKKGIYNTTTRHFTFSDSVVLVTPDYIIHSDTLRYNTATEMTWFFGPTFIYGNDNTIYCENGWYDTANDRASFSRNAYLISGDQKMWGDSLYYERKDGRGEAFGNVQVLDTVQNIIINGERATFFQNGDSSVITGEPYMTMMFSDDSLFLHGDTLVAVSDTLRDKILFAYHGVRFFKTDLQGKCDSLVYTGIDSLIRLYTDPVIWSDGSQITAEEIDMKIYQGKIESMKLLNEAFIVSAEDTFYNQIKGKLMDGWFTENQLSRIDVFGNGETLYFTREDTGAVFGMNKAISTNMRIHLTDNEVKEIMFIKRPVATLYPIKEVLPEEMKLENFEWLEADRPISKEDIFKN